MTRDELIVLIRELAEELRAKGTGVKLLSGSRLDVHLANQSDMMLRRIRRMYEDLLEEYKRADAGPPKRHTSKVSSFRRNGASAPNLPKLG